MTNDESEHGEVTHVMSCDRLNKKLEETTKKIEAPIKQTNKQTTQQQHHHHNNLLYLIEIG